MPGRDWTVDKHHHLKVTGVVAYLGAWSFLVRNGRLEKHHPLQCLRISHVSSGSQQHSAKILQMFKRGIVD